jgi:hypothetical protein
MRIQLRNFPRPGPRISAEGLPHGLATLGGSSGSSKPASGR